MTPKDYDVIVVGASFAGLSVARRLKGRVLLLDRNEVGTVQTSACGTPLWLPQRLGVEDSVLQVHDRLTIRTPTRSVSYDLSAVPFCTFDYKRFCRGLLAQSHARFLRAAVTGIEEGEVLTSEGRFRAPVVADCSGWRRALVTGRAAEPGAGDHSFGLEAHTAFSDDGLSFWLDRRMIPQGLGWVFPVGTGSLIGLGSYRGQSKLKPALERFLSDQGVAASSYHGAYFPNRLLPATVGRVFAVGDAAGQCLPLTAEGIRPAVYFGSECGRLIQRVLDGRLTLESALEAYRRLVERYAGAYRILKSAQWITAHAPTRWLAVLMELAARHPFLPRWWPRYGWFGLFDREAVPVAQ